MTDRPVYIPSRKRKKKQFFHGAFTGGFSAGHFNTVGTEEGWEPQENPQKIAQQKPQDFMDEQDHNEWGGPTSVREEYAAATSNRSAAAVKNDSMLELVKPPAQNVGHRLLRILGWRDGSTAYVPQDDNTVALLKPAEQSIESLLSSRRLRKVQLQQTRVKLPPPKLDTCGLGYEPYRNAPEFRAHRERRRKEAQERAKSVTASSAENRNVYRLSNLLDKNDNDESQHFSRSGHEEEDDPLVSYETEQSFVGTKTVGGFALHDDADDVYDNDKETKMDREEYDTVVYEHASDVEDEDTKGAAATGEEFGSVFASWATSKTNGDDKKKPSRGITSDGRPPLPGFVLGSSNTSKTAQRFPGPHIPSSYQGKRHQFRESEFAGSWKDESHAAKQELLEQRRKKLQAERKAEIIKKEKKRESGPMAGAAFAGLAAAMKNRFTSSAPDQSQQSSAIGLQAGGTGTLLSSVEPPVSVNEPSLKPITLQRTTMSFVPESLLCKRFHVVPPAHAKPTIVGKKVAEPKGEHAYFEREILGKATVPERAEPRKDKKSESSMLQEQLFGDSETQQQSVDTRPSMKVLESIFEPESESSESEEENDVAETVAAGPQDQLSGGGKVKSPAVLPEGIPAGVLAPEVKSPQADQEDGKDEEGESKSRKHERRRSRDDDERKRRRRSRSPSSGSDRSRRKRSRKRDEKKKRKKKHKSSRRSAKGD